MRRKFLAAFVAIIGMVTLIVNQETLRYGKDIFDYLITYGANETSSENLVTSVYLYYRYYDTLFEALLLIISVIAIIYLSIHKEHYHD